MRNSLMMHSHRMRRSPLLSQDSRHLMRRPHLMQRLQQLQLPLQSLSQPSPNSAEAAVRLLRQEAISATTVVHRSIKKFNGNALHEGFSVEKSLKIQRNLR